ncbi:MAG TPA: tyrosine-type recombinase/integrase [Jiangellaceae bacterium]|nr:tyrosine-type recombinase/integrase [Jiangellaceae bacterium]
MLTEIETGLRWGELIALREWHVDFLRRTITVEETIVEVSKKHSPTGERYIVKSYPKDDEPRVLGVRPHLLDELAAQIERLNLGRDDLLFPCRNRRRNAPQPQHVPYALLGPALAKAGLGVHMRMHDLRHAHASWLLAGGADLKTVMDRLGHSQIQRIDACINTNAVAAAWQLLDTSACPRFADIRPRHRPHSTRRSCHEPCHATVANA